MAKQRPAMGLLWSWQHRNKLPREDYGGGGGDGEMSLDANGKETNKLFCCQGS